MAGHGDPRFDVQYNVSVSVYMGVSLNGGTPKTPQNDHF